MKTNLNLLPQLPVILADISDAEIIRIVIRLVVLGVIVGLLWWLIDFAVEHPKFKKIFQVILAILAVLWLCRELLKISA